MTAYLLVAEVAEQRRKSPRFVLDERRSKNRRGAKTLSFHACATASSTGAPGGGGQLALDVGSPASGGALFSSPDPNSAASRVPLR